MSRTSLEVFFSAIDTLFFRGSRPHAAAGASTLPSEFPPPVSTLVGSLRTRLGDVLGADWSDLSKQPSIAAMIGGVDDTGELAFSAFRLYKNKQRLFPMPNVLLETADSEIVKLDLGEAVHCDLGYVRLPQLPMGVANAKPLENAWLTEEGFKRFLSGAIPEAEHIVRSRDLFTVESRLGIGRDAVSATVKSGLLYQTEHLRLAPEVEFSIVMSMPSQVADDFKASIKSAPLQRFGGEGRMAHLRVADTVNQAEFTSINAAKLLVLISDMLPESDFAQCPIKGLKPTQHEGVDCWEGEVHGVALRLWSVVSGKSKRYGGWDIRSNRPREVQSYLPAGSCFFVEPINGAALDTLHGTQIGRCIDFGFGTIVCAQSLREERK
ncbi:hypothetical protein AAEX37_02019 [Oligella sp. MSHR50489EDL]|uniref:type III-B CRISPR module-associated Cmr3 family protein n=1 Tax=Oligella sp. MSHR50489EDL TaxID=3139409 RepID=UPI003D815FAB